MTFGRDLDLPSDSAEFAIYLEQFCQDGSRALMRNGYRLRLAERKVMGARRLVPLGKVDEILHSSLSPQEKTALIANYLDEHETIGLGDPARFYVFAPFNVVRQILADFVAEAINLNGPFRSELDFQTELYSRHLAYGYVHRVAEELVSGGLPVDWKATEGTAEKLAKDEMRPPDSIPPWAEFCGKGNSRFILYEKANVVTSLVEMVWDSGLILAATTDDQIRLTEEHARCVFSETAILFIRVLDEIAFGALGAAVSEEFMEAFVECVGQALEGRGVHPERFAEVLSPRIAEYSRYTKWIPAKRESSRGTLFWEFGKKVADDFGIVKSAVFNLLLTNVLMGSLVEWRLVELLRGVAS